MLSKILGKMGREKNEDEFDVPEIYDRSDAAKDTGSQHKFDRNSTYSIRLLEKNDSIIN